VRITTDRSGRRPAGAPARGEDPFDRLARLASRLPGARRLERALGRHALTRRWVWFLAIYVISTTVFGAVALFLNAIVPK
jgi:hypothetical protein